MLVGWCNLCFPEVIICSRDKGRLYMPMNVSLFFWGGGKQRQLSDLHHLTVLEPRGVLPIFNRAVAIFSVEMVGDKNGRESVNTMIGHKQIELIGGI